MPAVVATAPRLHWTRHAPLFAAVLTSGAAICAWAVTLAPQFLGGPAGYVVVAGNSMEPKLSNGDLAVVRRRPGYEVGDVVAFRVPPGEAGAGSLVIHRIARGSASRGYVTRGDNRSGRDLWRPREADVVGSLWFSVPKGGVAFRLLRAPVVLALVAAALAFGLVVRPPAAWRRRRHASAIL
jgi:signal peptidase I